MFKLITSIPLIAVVAALVLFAGAFGLFYFDHQILGTLVAFLATAFGLLSYVGFRISKKVDAVTDTAIETVGRQAERVADVVIDRVKKKT